MRRLAHDLRRAWGLWRAVRTGRAKWADDGLGELRVENARLRLENNLLRHRNHDPADSYHLSE